jgi:hypothetical protein
MTQHPHPRGDSRGGYESGPGSSFRRKMCSDSGQRAGMRIAQPSRLGHRNSHHDWRSARRWQRDRACGQLPATGKRWQIFPDRRGALYPRKCLGSCRPPEDWNVTAPRDPALGSASPAVSASSLNPASGNSANSSAPPAGKKAWPYNLFTTNTEAHLSRK